jgi:hypothetical protein
MRVSMNKDDEIRSLCRQMVKLCHEYQMLRNTPGRESWESEIREDIIRLYARITLLQRRKAMHAPMHPGAIAQGGSRARFRPSAPGLFYP